jgi:hypothetical protein
MRRRREKKTIVHKRTSSFIDISPIHSGIVNVIVGCCNVGVLPNGLVFVPAFPS